jgi:hypothetical protein
MRIKNKEIRQRRHRKEQKVKEAARALRLQFGDKKTALPAGTKPKAAPAKKAAAPKSTVDNKPKPVARAKKPDGE